MSIALGLTLAGCDRDSPPEGEGSFDAAQRLLTEISDVSTGTVPPGYLRVDFGDGTWIAMKGIDSHNDPEGGTVAVVSDDGDAAVFFTHVCGPGPTPLESLVPPADTARMALQELRASMEEFKR